MRIKLLRALGFILGARVLNLWWKAATHKTEGWSCFLSCCWQWEATGGSTGMAVQESWEKE